MSWIFLATAGQFLNAVVAIFDKYIVTDTRVMPRPFVYAFYSCLFTGGWMLIFAVSLLPGLESVGIPHFRNIEWPTIQVVGMSFLAAYTFFMALVSMYTALKHADASDVMPVIGAVSALSTFALSYLLLKITVSPTFFWGILILAIGTLLVSQVRFTKEVALHTFHSGLFFALHYISLKGLFEETSFDDGFFWSRVCMVFFALSMLLVPAYLGKISEQTKATTVRGGVLVLLAKIIAGVAAFLLLKATDLGDVSVVQALDGLKYVFIIILGFLFGSILPQTAGENDFSMRTIIRKFCYVAIIATGFFILFQ